MSFYWYGQKTESLVIAQTTQSARMQTSWVLRVLHRNYLTDANPSFAPVLNDLDSAFTPEDGYQVHEWYTLNPWERGKPAKGPRDDFERETIKRFLASAEEG